MARRVKSRHYGGGISFPGGGGGICAKTVSDASLDPGNGSFTVALRYKCRTFGGVSTHVISEYSASYNTDGYLINQYANTILFYVKSGAAQLSCYIPDTSWHDWVFVADASDHSMHIYMDGVQVATSGAGVWASPITATSKVFTLGSGGEVPACTNGVITEAVYDVGHAWSSTDAANHHYDGTVPATATNVWPLDDGAGTTARASAGALTLSLIGGPAFTSDSPMIGRSLVRNAVRNSADPTQSNWSSGGVALLTPIAGSTPIGTSTSYAITESTDGSPATHYLIGESQIPAYLIGRRLRISAVVRAGTRGWVALYADNAGTNQYFNAASPAVGGIGGGAPTGAQIEDLGGGVVRCSFEWKPAVAGSCGLYVCTTNGNPAYQGNGSIAAYFYGLQIEEVGAGQTTPQTFVVTGATPLSVWGPRDERENLLRYSEAIGNAASWSADGGKGSTYALNAFTAPDGSNTASSFTYAGNGTNAVGVSVQTIYGLSGRSSPWTYTVWIYSPVTLSNYGLVISDGTIYSARQTGVTVPAITWTQLVYSIPAGTLNNTGQVAVGLSSTTYPPTGQAIYLWGAQLARTDQLPEYVRTTSALYCPNGAPRTRAA